MNVFKTCNLKKCLKGQNLDIFKLGFLNLKKILKGQNLDIFKLGILYVYLSNNSLVISGLCRLIFSI